MAELDGKFDPWIVDRNNVARWRHPDIVLGAEPSCDVDDFGSNGSIASSSEESLDAGPKDDDHECPEEPALGLEEEHSIDDRNAISDDENGAPQGTHPGSGLAESMEAEANEQHKTAVNPRRLFRSARRRAQRERRLQQAALETEQEESED
ncbi:unnamed protein product [Zymoseptoria tritici ST99CH_1A5]|uniref:Uncharacterized protein n=1 Tax=Zymoseptoria tritici ST99CH_1A5 TaxID=1276529 RepID=A0A1Y6M3P6_ZYMTR|nr:unnamed protein product [Zymoseptoria tritici ST99CH_1A5]